MLRICLVAILAFAVVTPLQTQEPPAATPPVAAPDEASPSKVDGLELPASMEVPYDEGFVNIDAKTTGEVQWLVLSTNEKIKYKVSSADKEITVAIPPNDTVISIFAVAVVDGKLTKFARCDITVKGPEAAQLSPNPPAPEASHKLHITIIEDAIRRTPDIAAVLNSAAVREKITSGAHLAIRIYDVGNPSHRTILQQKGFDRVVQKLPGLPLIVLQTADGTVKAAQVLPAKEAEVINLIDRVSREP